jgi:hypothetical protein
MTEILSGSEPVRRAAAALAALTWVAGVASAEPVVFDDFSYADVGALAAGGWTIRTAPGHPGVAGAAWGPEALALVDDDAPAAAKATAAGPAGNRLLRLTASTDGTPGGTHQAQLCHQRKLLAGTYAARIRFSDQPRAGAGGDPVIQSFYAVGELRFPFDPLFSEVDWEYLPDGGWGSPRPRLYGLSWQTVQIEPWQAFNEPHEEFGSHAGWHQLTMQVEAARVRLYVDDRLVATPSGRNVPVAPMALAFNLWFSPTGLLPAGGAPRVWEEDVDWVFHLAGRSIEPADVTARVAAYRARGVTREDTVPVPEPALPARCDM